MDRDLHGSDMKTLMILINTKAKKADTSPTHEQFVKDGTYPTVTSEKMMKV